MEPATKILCMGPLTKKNINPGGHTKGEKARFVKGHHKGPIPKDLIQSAQQRAASFYQRRNTLIQKADDIQKRTGCDVYIEISRNNKTYIYGTPAKLEEHQGLITDPSVATVQTLDSASVSSPVSLGPVETVSSPEILVAEPVVPIETAEVTVSQEEWTQGALADDHSYVPIPAAYPSPKKVMGNLENQPPISNNGAKNRLSRLQAAGKACRFCNVKHNSIADKNKGFWMGCDGKACKFWFHARCAGINVSSEAEAGKVPYLCPAHINA